MKNGIKGQSGHLIAVEWQTLRETSPRTSGCFPGFPFMGLRGGELVGRNELWVVFHLIDRLGVCKPLFDT